MAHSAEDHDRLFRRRGVKPRRIICDPEDTVQAVLEKKTATPEQLAQANLFVEHMRDRGENMEANRVGTSVHEKIEEVAADPGQLEELEKIITSVMKALVKLGASPDGPALIYVGTDGKVYRVDSPSCQFNESREAALADALIVTARSIVQSNRDRLRPPRMAPGYEPHRLAREAPLPEIKVRAEDGVDKDWGLVIGRDGEEQIRIGFIMDSGRFAYDEDDGRRRVTNQWREPMPGYVFARILNTPNKGQIVEGLVEGPSLTWNDGGLVINAGLKLQTKKFEVLQQSLDL